MAIYLLQNAMSLARVGSCNEPVHDLSETLLLACRLFKHSSCAKLGVPCICALFTNVMLRCSDVASHDAKRLPLWTDCVGASNCFPAVYF